VYRRVSDIQPKPIRWLWSRRIARGKVFMFAGHPRLGKSQAMITADQAMALAGDPDSDGERTARSEAEGWLRDTLKGGDSMDGKRLKGLANDSGIKERTLYRASEAIAVVTLSGGFGKPRRWHLCPMPGKGCHVCQDPEGA
jgi:hypothetical protein